MSLPTETGAHWPTLCALLAAGRITGALVHDARVAALCRQHGVRELWSADRDFSRFAGLAVANPLVVARIEVTAGSRQLVKQPLRFFQIGGVETLGERAVDGREQLGHSIASPRCPIGPNVTDHPQRAGAGSLLSG